MIFAVLDVSLNNGP